MLFAKQAVRSGKQCIYIRFAGHKAILEPSDGIEICYLDPAEGFEPEASFGTHFFLDLVEADILYIPLYPGDEGYFLDEGFFIGAPNELGKILIGYEDYNEIVRVIDVSESSQWLSAALLVNPDNKSAECYLVLSK